MELYKREKYLQKIRGFYDTEDLIKVVTGVRRCGKSSFMLTIVEELQAKGIPQENIIYIDLDSKAFRKIKTADQLENVIDKQAAANGRKYLFIDEIQNVKGFEEVINAYRTDGGYSIFITGSNSYLLSGELVTKLTGRYIEFELYPLTFEEYEEMKSFYGKSISSDHQQELRNYILEGGFPRTIFFDNINEKRRYVQSVVQEIFEKDIRKRVKIRDRQAFETVRNYVMNNFGAPASITSITRNLNKSGLKISRQTVSRYIQALLDAKIIYECDRFDMKSKRSLNGEKKYYLSDLSFYFSTNTDNRINFGPVLENIVYFYARSLDYAISVGRVGKLECDFILRNQEMDYAYVQVSYTILASKETEDREYRPLESIRDNYEKYVMTTDTFLQKRNGIRHVNLIDFMMNKKHF